VQAALDASSQGTRGRDLELKKKQDVALTSMKAEVMEKVVKMEESIKTLIVARCAHVDTSAAEVKLALDDARREYDDAKAAAEEMHGLYVHVIKNVNQLDQHRIDMVRAREQLSPCPCSCLSSPEKREGLAVKDASVAFGC
jgi:hypothetical protein